MTHRKRPLLRHLSLAIASLASALSLHAADVQNGGFDTATSNNANYWSSAGNPPGIGGTVRGGSGGGFSWSSGYFSGGYPTNGTFATTFSGTPVRQDLTGAGNTFVAGATYTITAKLFSAGAYADARNSKIMWSLGLTADGAPVAIDHWFSDEFAAQTVANGGPIPDDHIVTVATGSNGLTTATVTFTATAAEAGKTIGIQLGGNNQTKYTPVTGGPSDYYGMMDTVTFNSSLVPQLDTFTSDKSVRDGEPVTLYWNVVNPAAIGTLTLNDGTTSVDVRPLTSTEDGYGMTTVNPPAANTTYTLTLDGGASKQLTVFNGQVISFATSARIALAPEFKTTLSWEVRPLGATVSISDGTNTVDVTADTDAETGLGSREFVVPSASTNYTLSVNNGSVTRVQRVLRAVEANDHLTLNSSSIVTGSPVTVTWTNTGAASGSWIGVYSLNKTPGPQASDQWNYISGASGSMNFTLPPGQYFAILFVDGNYTIEQGPIYFTVADPVIVAPIQVMSLQRSTDVVAGEQLTIVWDSKAGVSYDIFASDSLTGNPQVDWQRIGTAVPSAGDDTTSFTEDLPEPTPARRFYRIYEVEPGI